MDAIPDNVVVAAETPILCLEESVCLHFRPSVSVWLRCVRAFVCFVLVWLINPLPFIQVVSVFLGSGYLTLVQTSSEMY